MGGDLEAKPCHAIFQRVFLLFLFVIPIVCIIYPLVLWAIGQVFFPFQANGSIVNGPRWKAGRLDADRAAVHQGRVLSAAAVGGVIRRVGVGAVEPFRFELRSARSRRAFAWSNR